MQKQTIFFYKNTKAVHLKMHKIHFKRLRLIEIKESLKLSKEGNKKKYKDLKKV